MILALLQLQTSVEAPVRPGASGLGRMPGMMHDILIIVGVGLVLTLLLMFWAKYIRRRSRHHSDPRVTYRVVEAGGDGGGGSRKRRHRHRRRRRDHRTRNPTLAETGGLPPSRPEDEVPPSI